MTELYRDNRDNPSLCVTCAGQNYRDKRDTPLGGVTTVTLVGWLANLVPMPLILGGGASVGRGLHSTHTMGVLV